MKEQPQTSTKTQKGATMSSTVQLMNMRDDLHKFIDDYIEDALTAQLKSAKTGEVIHEGIYKDVLYLIARGEEFPVVWVDLSAMYGKTYKPLASRGAITFSTVEAYLYARGGSLWLKCQFNYQPTFEYTMRLMKIVVGDILAQASM